jgi:uncharacterized protein
MKCPVCSKEMVSENFGDATVQVCENGCKGIWFDHGELAMLDAKDKGSGAALEAALRSPRNNDGKRGQIACPQCGLLMHSHKYIRDKEVNVDECYKCGGFFLDSGELTEIRDNYMNDAEVNAYMQKMIAAAPSYSEEIGKEKRLDAVEKLSEFLTVNYWQKKFQ